MISPTRLPDAIRMQDVRHRHRPLFGVDRDWTPCSSNQRDLAPRNSEKILIYSATNRYTIRTEIAPFVAYFRNTTRYP